MRRGAWRLKPPVVPPVGRAAERVWRWRSQVTRSRSPQTTSTGRGCSRDGPPLIANVHLRNAARVMRKTRPCRERLVLAGALVVIRELVRVTQVRFVQSVDDVTNPPRNQSMHAGQPRQSLLES